MLTFIYTACSDVCPQLEKNLSQVYDAIPEKYVGEAIVLLSLSFDPTRDDPEVLDRYRQAFGRDGETWRMAIINDEEEREALLNAFGVIVIPDENGHFAHNAAFYLVNPDGDLVDVMDYEKIDEAAKKVHSILLSKEET